MLGSAAVAAPAVESTNLGGGGIYLGAPIAVRAVATYTVSYCFNVHAARSHCLALLLQSLRIGRSAAHAVLMMPPMLRTNARVCWLRSQCCQLLVAPLGPYYTILYFVLGQCMQHLSRHRVGSKTEALRLLSQGHARRSNLQTAIGSSSSRVRPIPSRGHCLPCPRSHSFPVDRRMAASCPLPSALPSRAPHAGSLQRLRGHVRGPRALAGDGAGVHRARAVVCVLAAVAGRHAAPLAHDDLRPPRARQGACR